MFLSFNLRLRKLATQSAKSGRLNLLAVGFFDLMFDRQAMAIPTGHVWRIEPGQRFTLDDDVFENLIRRMANMNIAVRIGRAIVQNKFWPPLTRRADAFIHAFFLPRFEHGGFAFSQIAAHGKRRIG